MKSNYNNKTLFQMKMQSINFGKWEHNTSVSVHFVLREISTPSLSEYFFYYFNEETISDGISIAYLIVVSIFITMKR